MKRNAIRFRYASLSKVACEDGKNQRKMFGALITGALRAATIAEIHCASPKNTVGSLSAPSTVLQDADPLGQHFPF